MIAYDKRLHFEAGMITALVFYLFGSQLDGMILMAFFVGVFKEIIDLRQLTGLFDWVDVAFTFAGGVMIATIFYMFGLVRIFL